ncbi:hypothetical protein D083_3523 [Dickeya solani RNS 08.23.3.1.A]|nr:hypothetical protein D083_3523 [Dickeya solani RNS 08.23.3.1.A]
MHNGQMNNGQIPNGQIPNDQMIAGLQGRSRHPRIENVAYQWRIVEMVISSVPIHQTVY